MIGKYVLAGVTKRNSDDELISREKLHGKVLRVTEEYGVINLQKDGSEFGLPPLLDCYHVADKGVYSLKATDETIRDPDYLATFEVTVSENDS